MKKLWQNKFIRLLILCLLLVAIEGSSFLLVKITPFKHIMLADYYLVNWPVIKEFVVFYYTWYLMLFIVPIILYYKDRERQKDYIMTYMVTIFLSSIIFFFFPTELVRDAYVGKGFFNFFLNIIYYVDTPTLNCLPSMHCTLCFLFIYYSLVSKNIKWYYRLLIVMISLLIMASTILIKQHVVYDIYGALIVAVLSIMIVKNTKSSNLSERLLKKFSL